MSTRYFNVSSFDPLTNLNFLDYDSTNTFPEYLTFSCTDPETGEDGFWVAFTSGSLAPSARSTFTPGLSSLSGIEYSTGGVLSAVSGISIDLIDSIQDSTIVNGDLCMVLTKGDDNAWVMNYTTMDAVRLKSPVNELTSPAVNSIALNSTLFGQYTNLSGSTDFGFFDLSNNFVLMDTISCEPSYSFTSRTGYGYYIPTFTDSVSGLGTRATELKQASYIDGVKTLKTLSISAENTTNWDIFWTNNYIDKTICANRTYITWTDGISSSMIDVYTIDEVTLTVKKLIYSGTSRYFYNSFITGDRVIDNVIDWAILDPNANTNDLVSDIINGYNIPGVTFGNFLGVAGDALIANANINGQSYCTAFDTDNHEEYIGIWPKAVFLRLRLLGYF